MNCAEYRRLLLTDPGDPPVAMRTHIASCPECTQYTARISRFEGRLEKAVKVDIHGALRGRVVSLQAERLRRRGKKSALRAPRVAIAASVLLAVVGVGLLWLGAPGRSLAAAVVNHMADEPDAWARTQVAVAEPKLEEVMSGTGAHLRPGAGLVSYAHSCEFRGHVVPHLVVQTAAGPVTVMLLVHESLRRDVHFAEHGYSGVIVPLHGHGSLAVLERHSDTDAKTINAVAAQVTGALDWREVPIPE
jgi:hypothetical protein